LLSHPLRGYVVVRLIPVLLALFFTSAAMADDWKEYENRDYSFTVHFPGDPTVETTTYKAADGRAFPAHVFSVKQETGVFKATVVDMPGEQTGPDAGAMKEATKGNGFERPTSRAPGLPAILAVVR
jgi:hypothetical protein